MKKTPSQSVLSIGKSKKVCGYEIKKMPIGAYIKAMERFSNLSEEFVEVCFPGNELQDIIDMVSNLNEDSLLQLVCGILSGAPKFAIGIVSDLTGIDEERLLNDNDIGLKGLTDIMTIFFEVNELGEFLQSAKGMVKKAKAMSIGFKA